MNTPPNRLRIEAALGRSLLNWQWCALLAILGFPVSRVVPIEAQVMRETVSAPPEPAPTPERDDDHDRTCEVCGRVGVRRFVKTATGWKCSASASRCVGNRPGFKADVIEILEAHD